MCHLYQLAEVMITFKSALSFQSRAADCLISFRHMHVVGGKDVFDQGHLLHHADQTSLHLLESKSIHLHWNLWAGHLRLFCD